MKLTAEHPATSFSLPMLLQQSQKTMYNDNNYSISYEVTRDYRSTFSRLRREDAIETLRNIILGMVAGALIVLTIYLDLVHRRLTEGGKRSTSAKEQLTQSETHYSLTN